jgi:hypothetical protein
VLRRKGALVEKKALITIPSVVCYPADTQVEIITAMASKDRKLMGRLREKEIL